MSAQEVESVLTYGTSGGMPSFVFTQEELNALTFYLSETYNPNAE